MSGRRYKGAWSSPGKPREYLLLDKFSIADIKEWTELQDSILKYHWDYYCDLAYKRSKIANEIKTSLLEAAEKSYKFVRWQRVIKYKYALEPLLMTGSLVDPGGRFNIGKINPAQFPPFPALYIAIDKATALQEILCKQKEPGTKLINLDFALTNPASIVSISVSGSLDSVINLKRPETLEKFIELIKKLSISERIIEIAKKLKLHPPELIRDTKKLLEELLNPYWRVWPMQFDVPSPSQIFGQLVAEAGIEGILYPSKFTEKDCLAIFPQNFEHTESFIQLDDESPKGTNVRRLDAKSIGKIISNKPL